MSKPLASATPRDWRTNKPLPKPNRSHRAERGTMSIDEILDTLVHNAILYGRGQEAHLDDIQIDTKQDINAYILGEVMAIIGDDFEFERPKDDYLPNFYIHAKAKNEVRQELRYKANEKFGGEL